MTDTPKTLAPCPFCGGEAHFAEWEDEGHGTQYAGIRCRLCPVEVGFVVTWSEAVGEPFAKAAAAWNRRALPSDDEVERVAREMALFAIAEEYRIGQVQGFLYGNFRVIRDCWLSPEKQEIWRAHVDSSSDDDMMLEIEAYRTALCLHAAIAAMRGE